MTHVDTSSSSSSGRVYDTPNCRKRGLINKTPLVYTSGVLFCRLLRCHRSGCCVIITGEANYGHPFTLWAHIIHAANCCLSTRGSGSVNVRDKPGHKAWINSQRRRIEGGGVWCCCHQVKRRTVDTLKVLEWLISQLMRVCGYMGSALSPNVQLE